LSEAFLGLDILKRKEKKIDAWEGVSMLQGYGIASSWRSV